MKTAGTAVGISTVHTVHDFFYVQDFVLHSLQKSVKAHYIYKPRQTSSTAVLIKFSCNGFRLNNVPHVWPAGLFGCLVVLLVAASPLGERNTASEDWALLPHIPPPPKYSILATVINLDSGTLLRIRTFAMDSYPTFHCDTAPDPAALNSKDLLYLTGA